MSQTTTIAKTATISKTSMAKSSENSTKTYQPPKNFANGNGILCAGLPRSGTSSLTEALEILGVSPVHHALKLTDRAEYLSWGHAAWCSFPSLRKASGGKRPFYISQYDPLLPWSRGQWDGLIGRHRAVTDLASVFSEQIIACYPEAKVILVERNLDSWMDSFGGALVDGWLYGFNDFMLHTVSNWVGYVYAAGLRDANRGWVGANSRREAYEKMPALHRDHYAMVRERVPKEQLLDFKLKDGWEPLCKFLDVPVPDVPFPHVNERDALLRFRNFRMMLVIYGLLLKVGTFGLIVGVSMYALKGAAQTGLLAVLAGYKDLIVNWMYN